MAIDSNFWARQKVLITGHTGFKGAWLSLVLNRLGATVSGYSLAESPTAPCLFDIAKLSSLFECDARADISDLTTLKRVVEEVQPSILFHMAAQSLVLDGYNDPITTYMTNTMGTANTLEAARAVPSVKAIVVVTTDKCYQNTEGEHRYNETSALGGYDPYSNSKACAELVVASYRSSFFGHEDSAQIATARAGNVIGGGDWAENRLVPDCYRAFSVNKPIELRHPRSIRPWQHVLEPLTGYLLLAQKLSNRDEGSASAWNFGPTKQDELETQQVAELAQSAWGSGEIIMGSLSESPVETQILRLDSSKAAKELKWQPKWSAEQALSNAMSWYYQVHNGADPRTETEKQIAEYFA